MFFKSVNVLKSFRLIGLKDYNLNAPKLADQICLLLILRSPQEYFVKIKMEDWNLLYLKLI